jgi:hypothetical protein
VELSPVDNPGCGAAPAGLSTVPKVGSDRLGGHCCSSQSRLSATPPGYRRRDTIVNEAGYVIVNELAFALSSCGVTRIPAGLYLLPSSCRSPTGARGSLSSRDSITSRTVPRSVLKACCRCQEGINAGP